MKKKEAHKKAGIRPLADRVLLRPISDLAEKTKGGIIIPETISKEKPEQGQVIAVGPGRYVDGKLIPLDVKVGDVVLFSKYGYDELKVDGEEYIIVREENILAII